MELNEETFSPLFTGLAAAKGLVMSLLEQAPLGREEAFKEVLPANGGLGLDCCGDGWIIGGSIRELGLAPSREVGQDGLLQSGESLGVRQVLGELVEV